jgi:hypothetical protein
VRPRAKKKRKMPASFGKGTLNAWPSHHLLWGFLKIEYASENLEVYPAAVKRLNTRRNCDVISSFRRVVNEIFVPLGCYAAWIGSYRLFGTTCISHISGSSCPRRTGCPKTFLTNYQCTLLNIS